jgi:hypothetical protein
MTLNTVIESRCWKVAFVLTVAFSLLILNVHSVKAAEPAPRGKVALSLKADDKQPRGGPVVVEVTMTNLGSEDIHWWCGGPDRFPQASQFKIEVAYLYDETRFPESASNGQYSEGSGIYRHLSPGESMTVPLAIVIHEPDNTKLCPGQKAYDGVVRIRVSAIDWETDAPGETLVHLSGDKEVVDQRRTNVLKAIANDGPPFWLHFAQTYADDVVLDTMLKLAAIEVDPISKNAILALAWQPKLPESVGKDLAVMVRGLMMKKKPISTHSPSGDILKCCSENSERRSANGCSRLLEGFKRW